MNDYEEQLNVIKEAQNEILLAKSIKAWHPSLNDASGALMSLDWDKISQNKKAKKKLLLHLGHLISEMKN